MKRTIVRMIAAVIVCAMPIPAFNTGSVLPPYLNDPTNPDDVSPYLATSEEVCARFATSQTRKDILKGWLDFRAAIHSEGVINGFQWLDGSFLEDIEKLERRPPDDLDVVTFYIPATPTFSSNFRQNNLPLMDEAQVNQKYRIHHFFEDINFTPEYTVDAARYWHSLFTHRRNGVRKGILRVDLGTIPGDNTARGLL